MEENDPDLIAAHPRKLQILAAAVRCFLAKGYQQTGVRDIARQAGISLGNLYNHFPGKEAVLAEIASIEGRELKQFEQLLTNHDDPQATLAQFCVDYAAYAAHPENALLGLDILSEAMRKPEIAALFTGNRAGLVAALQTLLQQGIDKGCFRHMADPGETARLILDMIEGQALRRVLEDDGDAAGGTALKTFIDRAVCR